MIPIEKLKQVRNIITHANCPDGIASAILLHDALPDAQIRFLTHGTKEYAELLPSPDGRTLFCDISPPKDSVSRFIDAGAIVLDHHKSAEGVVKAFGALGVFADEKEEPGVSGAVLAHREVWVRILTPTNMSDSRLWEAERFARIAGARDTWQTSSPVEFREGCEQAEALRFWPVDEWLTFKDPFLYTSAFKARLELGSVLFKKKIETAKREIDRAWRVKSQKGTRCIIFEGTFLTSDIAELLEDDVDLVIGFGFSVEDGKHLFNVSTRSHTTFNCAAFAKVMGGGGHTKAAGFTYPFGDRVMDFPNPYRAVLSFVDGFEAL